MTIKQEDEIDEIVKQVARMEPRDLAVAIADTFEPSNLDRIRKALARRGLKYEFTMQIWIAINSSECFACAAGTVVIDRCLKKRLVPSLDYLWAVERKVDQKLTAGYISSLEDWSEENEMKYGGSQRSRLAALRSEVEEWL